MNASVNWYDSRRTHSRFKTLRRFLGGALLVLIRPSPSPSPRLCGSRGLHDIRAVTLRGLVEGAVAARDFVGCAVTTGGFGGCAVAADERDGDTDCRNVSSSESTLM